VIMICINNIDSNTSVFVTLCKQVNKEISKLSGKYMYVSSMLCYSNGTDDKITCVCQCVCVVSVCRLPCGRDFCSIFMKFCRVVVGLSYSNGTEKN